MLEDELRAMLNRKKRQGEELEWFDEQRMWMKQKIILRQTRHKFGDVPESVVKRLKAIMDDDVLDALADRILDAQSLEDMGLSDDTSLT